jgi:hypothetical protein
LEAKLNTEAEPLPHGLDHWMETEPKTANRASSNQGGPERRSQPRIYEPFPAQVFGVDTDGHAFETKAVLDNLSAGGLYVRLRQPVSQGTTLSIIVRLSTNLRDEAVGARIAAQSVVVRAEPQADGGYGVAVAFKRHRFVD